MKKKTMAQILKQIICLCMVAVVMAPILLTLFAALKNKVDMVKTSPLSLPALDRLTFAIKAASSIVRYCRLPFLPRSPVCASFFLR